MDLCKNWNYSVVVGLILTARPSPGTDEIQPRVAQGASRARPGLILASFVD